MSKLKFFCSLSITAEKDMFYKSTELILEKPAVFIDKNKAHLFLKQKAHRIVGIIFIFTLTS